MVHTALAFELNSVVIEEGRIEPSMKYLSVVIAWNVPAENRFKWVFFACCMDEFLVPHWGGLKKHLRSRGNWSEILSYASFH